MIKPDWERPTSGLISTVFFCDKISGKLGAGLAASPDTFTKTPLGECVGVDIYAFDDIAVIFKSSLGFLRSLYPVFPTTNKLFAVFKDSEQGQIIFLPNPGDSNGTSIGV
jgi:hypothetical protein